jgi:hyperosmotically inducible periplasmic protein
MMRTLLRAILVLVILVAAAGFLLGWWGGTRLHPGSRTPAVATTGKSPAPSGVDTSRAREVGAKIGEKTAIAAAKAEEVISDGAVTAKIKSKMALDDSVQARRIDVSTDHGVVTVSGTVRSREERDRAVQLARETDGVTRVIDHLTVER